MITAPDTNLLPLIGEMLPVAPVEVVRLHAGRRRAEVVLGAAGRGQVAVVARILCHLRSQDFGHSVMVFIDISAKKWFLG